MNHILNPISPLVRLAGLLVVMLFFTVDLKAQYPVIHIHWTALEESPKLIDPTYTVIECTKDTPEIFIRLFNENPTAQELDFSLIVSYDTLTPVVYDVTDYKLAKAAMVNPTCGSTKYSDLRFDVPSGFDPKKLKVKISYP